MKMNKTRLLEKISIQSGVSLDECGTVLKTFEKVLSEELSRKMYRYGGWILLLIALFVSVTVKLSEKEGAGTITDSLGRFSIPQVPVGRHTVEAAFMGYEPGIFREILVTSAKEIYLEIPLKESVNELNEVIIRARTNKEEAMNKMATTGARMLSVEEASRYAGGFDDPARLPEWLPAFLPMEFLFMAMPHICCNGDWRMSKFLIRITLRTSLHWVEESFPL